MMSLLASFFTVKKKNCYAYFHMHCRASHAKFVVSYQDYVKSIASQIPIGARFKKKFVKDDSSERRLSSHIFSPIICLWL